VIELHDCRCSPVSPLARVLATKRDAGCRVLNAKSGLIAVRSLAGQNYPNDWLNASLSDAPLLCCRKLRRRESSGRVHLSTFQRWMLLLRGRSRVVSPELAQLRTEYRAAHDRCPRQPWPLQSGRRPFAGRAYPPAFIHSLQRRFTSEGTLPFRCPGRGPAHCDVTTFSSSPRHPGAATEWIREFDSRNVIGVLAASVTQRHRLR
jgi:hypothetical protein